MQYTGFTITDTQVYASHFVVYQVFTTWTVNRITLPFKLSQVIIYEIDRFYSKTTIS